ncbi:MAG: adenylyltransferase/cytidyltransferase family protein [Planctomycetota bacterium]
MHEAASMGPVHARLWSDALTARLTGRPPRFPEAERLYVLDAIRYVERVTLCDRLDRGTGMPANCEVPGATWVVDEASDHPDQLAWCQDHGLGYHVVPDEALRTIPESIPPVDSGSSGVKKVIVTGCYDWFHSGHVRFFEEVSQLGRLYVIVGHDANIRLLKGKGHPMFPEQERRYVVGAVKHVHRALISTGNGWLDAEPEIEWIRPDIYAVNEDGARPEKRAYCEANGIEYRVLERTPKEGLPRRQSTDLRGF